MVPVVKLGIDPPDKMKCLSLALAFRIYHSACNDYLQRLLGYKRLGNLDDIFALTIEIARVNWRDIQRALDIHRHETTSGGSRVPVSGRRASSCTSGTRASPTVQSSGARSSFVAQVDAAMPAAWGHRQ